MIKEAYCSFEVAKLLKEKGFDEICRSFWKDWDNKIVLYNADRGQAFDYCDNTMLTEQFHSNDETNIAAPTQAMAMAWLRDKGLCINCPITYDSSLDADGNEADRWVFWSFQILSSFSGNLIYTEEEDTVFSTYEEAVEAALKYSLENLIWEKVCKSNPVKFIEEDRKRKQQEQMQREAGRLARRLRWY